jgi:divalent metal cation (Fe/Co/Zn/Cd) transporter
MLRDKGKLKGVLTEEHFHDLGKLVFSFSVFWAYIAFSQYFLIWYSNIPEETAWFLIRRQGMWNYVFIFLCLGHFVLPFLFLLSRHVKRNPRLLATAAALLLFVHAIDIFFIVRPMVTIDSPALLKAGLEASTDRFWIDGCALVGAFGIFFAFLLRRIASRPLVPLADPRTGEALEHKNYV